MPELNNSMDLEARRETGTACMIIGAILWMVAFIAMFFHPAAWISGSLAIVEYAGALVIVGSVVFFLGWRARRRAKA